jgi:Holliday junction resolvasome RuvABC endonuclease subunit
MMETDPANIEVIGLDPSYTGFGVSSRKDTFVVSTKPSDTQTTSQNCQRRCQEVMWRIAHHITSELDPAKTILFIVEGPSHGKANHGFEVGWMMNEIYNRLPTLINRPASILEVPPSTLKKAITGNGGPDKDKLRMKASIKEKYGVEFELDKGGNKADSFALYKYGIGVLTGLIEHHITARRGKGGRKNKPSKGNSKRAIHSGSTSKTRATRAVSARDTTKRKRTARSLN